MIDRDLSGWVVGVPVRAYRVLPVQHVGLLTDARDRFGHPLVIHASPHLGGVVETELAEFCLKARGTPYLVGYPSELDPEEVLERARERLGQPYRFWKSNCEHLVWAAHGLPPDSPQLRMWRERALKVNANPWGLGEQTLLGRVLR